MASNRSLEIQLDSMIWTNVKQDDIRVLKNMRARDILNDFSFWFRRTLINNNLDFDAFYEDSGVKHAILLLCAYTMNVNLGKPAEEPELDL